MEFIFCFTQAQKPPGPPNVNLHLSVRYFVYFLNIHVKDGHGDQKT